ncbi:MAG: hypothetical protein U1C70_10705 [Sediminibacterium sp.]|uniref:hypothetical protein n=1 Tax=Sediminibacterium sp. TaxID=1917865 RepID=UPI002AB9AF71|nr:hypothetical protein [Sediminibacterium sp.]MDZ4072286.1 hypothetical protein [Sediminibacterium sp.]
MGIIKTPIDFKEENVAVRISRFNETIIESRIKELDSSDNLFVLVYFGNTKNTEQLTENRLITDFMIVVRDGKTDEAIIFATITAVLYKDEIINEPNDLWILVNKCFNLLSDAVKELELKDMNGSVLVMPQFLLAPDQFKGFVYHN